MRDSYKHLPDEVIKAVMEMEGFDCETHEDAMYLHEFLDRLAAHELFDYWLRYNGIIGYTDKILRVYGEIRKAVKHEQNGNQVHA